MHEVVVRNAKPQMLRAVSPTQVRADLTADQPLVLLVDERHLQDRKSAHRREYMRTVCTPRTPTQTQGAGSTFKSQVTRIDQLGRCEPGVGDAAGFDGGERKPVADVRIPHDVGLIDADRVTFAVITQSLTLGSRIDERARCKPDDGPEVR